MLFIKEIFSNVIANIITSKIILTLIIIMGVIVAFLFTSDAKTIKRLSDLTGLDLSAFLGYIKAFFTLGFLRKE